MERRKTMDWLVCGAWIVVGAIFGVALGFHAQYQQTKRFIIKYEEEKQKADVAIALFRAIQNKR